MGGLAGYPKRFDHPQITRLVEGESKNTGNLWLLKSMGDVPSDWIEYEVKYPNSATPDTTHTIRATVGTVLHGPFSYIKHNDEGITGGTGTRNCYSLIYEVED